MRRFYGHFAAAYGTCWLALLAFALLTQSHIEGGPIALFGFPVVSFWYALYRRRRSAGAGTPMNR
jgi:hypothetical protein